MTKMATMPIYSKYPLKIIFSRTTSLIALKFCTKHQGLEPSKAYINDDPGLTLAYLQGQLCSLRLLHHKILYKSKVYEPKSLNLVYK